MLSMFASLFAKHQWGDSAQTRTCIVCGCVEELTVGILTEDFYSPLKRGSPMMHFQRPVADNTRAECDQRQPATSNFVA